MKRLTFILILFICYVSGFSLTTKRIEAEYFDACTTGIRSEINSALSGTGNVGYITNGSWIKFIGYTFNGYDRQFNFAASTGTAGGLIEIRLDAANGALIGQAAITGSGGWSIYKTVTTTVTQTTGIHDLYLVFKGGSGYLFNLNFFDIITNTPNAVHSYFSTSLNPVQTGTLQSNIIGDSVEVGTNITVKAKANSGYYFDRWTDKNGVFISSDNPYNFTISSNTTLIAQFRNGVFLNLSPPATGGFANVAGNGVQAVTGGNGGYVVVAKNLDELRLYATSTDPYTIIVNGKISPGSWNQIDVNSNKTIVGYGDNATLKNIELNMVNKNNIIIRNLNIRDSKVPSDTTKAFDYDAIQADSTKHLWIDHCFLTNCNDGLIDLRFSCDYVTTSWNHLSNHNKAFGIGWTSATDYRITIHHSWIDNTVQRNPSFGNGSGHLYNNYLSNISSYGNFARGNAILVVQNSQFDKVNNPLQYDTAAILYSSGNQFRTCTGSNAGNTTVMPFNPANLYSFTLDNTSEVIDKIVAGSGPQWSVGDEYSTLLPKYTLSTLVEGSGKVTPSSGNFLANGLIHINAIPSPGWEFDHWSGDFNGNIADTTMVLNANSTITAHFIEEIISSASSGDYIATASGDISNTANWNVSGGPFGMTGNANSAPTISSNLVIPAGISMSNAVSANCNNMQIRGNYTANAPINIAGNLKIFSLAEGTGTIISNGNISVSGTITVQQHLKDVRNWYISSPVGNATALSGYTYYRYDETGSHPSLVGPYWVAVLPGETLTPGVGYVVLPATAGSTFEFTTPSGGSLNSGNVNITLTKTGALKNGYNLIGNPYPAHLTWSQTFVVNNADKILPTIWYRTNSGTGNNSGQWNFQTYNAQTGEASPAGTTGIIPPMQAFWVKAVSAGTLTLNSDLTLSHQAGNPLKVPVDFISERERLRLQISNKKFTDETLIYFDSQAQNGYDLFDSPKMSNNSTYVPEIFTQVGTEKVALNGLSNLNRITELPLGFSIGQVDTLKLRVLQKENFDPEMQIILQDKILQTETELTTSTEYTFPTTASNTTDRFAILFKSSSLTTHLESDNLNYRVIISDNGNNQILIKNDLDSVLDVTVYNLAGQKIHAEKISEVVTILNKTFDCGVYSVAVSSGTKNSNFKVLIK